MATTGDRQTSQTLGRLEGQVESLNDLLGEIRGALASQIQTQAKHEEQLRNIGSEVGDLRTTLSGADGSTGIAARLQRLEQTLEAAEKDMQSIRRVLDDSKKTIVKVILLVLGSGAVSGGVASKILSALAN